MGAYLLVAAAVALALTALALQEPSALTRSEPPHRWIEITVYVVALALLWPAALLFLVVPELVKHVASRMRNRPGSGG